MQSLIIIHTENLHRVTYCRQQSIHDIFACRWRSMQYSCKFGTGLCFGYKCFKIRLGVRAYKILDALLKHKGNGKRANFGLPMQIKKPCCWWWQWRLPGGWHGGLLDKRGQHASTLIGQDNFDHNVGVHILGLTARTQWQPTNWFLLSWPQHKRNKSPAFTETWIRMCLLGH